MRMCNAESLKMSEKGSNVRKDDRALPPMVLFLSALNTYGSMPNLGPVWINIHNKQELITPAKLKTKATFHLSQRWALKTKATFHL